MYRDRRFFLKEQFQKFCDENLKNLDLKNISFSFEINENKNAEVSRVLDAYVYKHCQNTDFDFDEIFEILISSRNEIPLEIKVIFSVDNNNKVHFIISEKIRKFHVLKNFNKEKKLPFFPFKF